jgi:hypothetical protein
MQREVVWLPSEPQLRRLLGAAFVALRRRDGGYTCQARLSGRVCDFQAAGAADAYGLALLATLAEQQT